jgi:capsular polysaccharide biosynthesis protein
LSQDMNQTNIHRLPKLLIIITFIIVFLSCLIRIIYSPPVYQVKAAVLIEKRDVSIEKVDQLSEQTFTQVNNVLQKLKSSSLLHKTLQKLNYPSSPQSPEFTDIQKRLSIRQILPSNVIEVTLSYHSSTQAALIVNTLIETLMDENLVNRRQKVKLALDSVQSSLAEIQSEKLQLAMYTQPSATSRPTSANTYLTETGNAIGNVEQQLAKIVSTLSPQDKNTVEITLVPQNLAGFKPNLTIMERDLVANLCAEGWNGRRVKNQQKTIWIEKTKATDYLKEIVSQKADLTKNNSLTELCALQVKLYDLQIRQNELQLLVPNQDKQPPVLEKEKQIASLKELEDRLISKQIELQNVDELSFTEISWIDKAIAVPKPSFPPNIYISFGLSLGAGLLASLVIGLFYVEFKKYHERLVN